MREESGKKKSYKSPKTPEDKIFGRVIARLRVQVEVSYTDIEEWTAEQGMRIPYNSDYLLGGDMAEQEFVNIQMQVDNQFKNVEILPLFELAEQAG